MGKLLEQLRVDPDEGLTDEEAAERREEHGPNRLREVVRERLWTILARQFRSLIMLVLALAAVLSALFSRWIDALAILAAMLINAAIGFFTELQAHRSMESLQEMDRTYATVRRGGASVELDAEELVPGDIVLVESGDMISADLRVLVSNNLQADESALTGESVPVQKSPDPVEADAPLAERSSMLFKGTAVTQGSGEAMVVRTGMDTEMGGVASLVGEAEAESDPLQVQLNGLASSLVKAIVVVAALAGLAGLLGGKELLFMVETAVALFVAAVPEGLPIVATLALARGMHRMARRRALVRRLSAVQTLGATNVILTDKTGTLTENRMTVRSFRSTGKRVEMQGTGLSTEGSFRADGGEIEPLDGGTLEEALRVGVLCNNASLQAGETRGDPTEVALLVWGAKAGLERDRLLDEMEEVREVAFDPDAKRMATVHRVEDGFLAAVKGAPAAVLDVCSREMTEGGPRKMDEEGRERWLQLNREMAAEGLRVLALARGQLGDPGSEVYADLTFLGLVGLDDPVREEVREPLRRCVQAGIRVVMVTGDQEETARAVARDLQLLDADMEPVPGSRIADSGAPGENGRSELLTGTVFYRVTPEQKLRLLALHQEEGDIVGMTGDGVNDAPALKKADIGIAMGERGEPVAEDAADIVLQDDRFATVTMAVEQGRVIFESIREFVVYMISGNIGEIVLVFLASLVGAPLPLLPLQILYINAVNDIFPALALGVGPGSGLEMERPPRARGEPIMTRAHWYIMGIFGLVVGLPVLASFALALTVLGYGATEAATLSFLAVAFARLWHVFNMRDPGSSILRNQVTTNPLVWGALALCTALLLLAVYVPPLASVLEVVPPDPQGWLLVAVTSLVPLLLGQIVLELGWLPGRGKGSGRRE